MNLLVAEDEKDIRNLIKLKLTQEAYCVLEARDGLEALELIQNNPVDLALLDVMMPGLDGFNLLRKIRTFSNVPVIFLTARGDEMDKILGLGLGADDYLVKPFSMGELLARVSAHLRRHHEYVAKEHERSKRIIIGELALDNDACSLQKGDAILELNAKEFKLIKYLMENPGRVFTKKQLYKAVWEEEVYYDDNTVMVHISHLRNKIETDPRNPDYIITVRGIGYKFQKQGESV